MTYELIVVRLPDDWQQQYWGTDSATWPSPDTDSDGDGASNLQEFLAGTDPTNAKSVLRTQIRNSDHGPRLEWNTEPGLLFQSPPSGWKLEALLNRHPAATRRHLRFGRRDAGGIKENRTGSRRCKRARSAGSCEPRSFRQERLCVR